MISGLAAPNAGSSRHPHNRPPRATIARQNAPPYEKSGLAAAL